MLAEQNIGHLFPTRLIVTPPLKIALVVDNPAGVLSMQEMLRHSGADHGLQVLESGEEALEYINALAEALELPPDLLVLDLQWPGEWGFAILATIGSHSSLSGLAGFSSSAEAGQGSPSTFWNALHFSCRCSWKLETITIGIFRVSGACASWLASVKPSAS